MATYQTFWGFESQLLEHFTHVLCSWFAYPYSLFFTPGSPFKSNLLLRSFALYNYFVFPQLVFEPCYILLEDGTHSSHSHGHNAKHRQSVQRITFVISYCCCRYKLLEVSRLLGHADMRIIELSKRFHQVKQLLRNIIEICSFVSFWNVPEDLVNVYNDPIM